MYYILAACKRRPSPLLYNKFEYSDTGHQQWHHKSNGALDTNPIK